MGVSSEWGVRRESASRVGWGTHLLNEDSVRRRSLVDYITIRTPSHAKPGPCIRSEGLKLGKITGRTDHIGVRIRSAWKCGRDLTTIVRLGCSWTQRNRRFLLNLQTSTSI